MGDTACWASTLPSRSPTRARSRAVATASTCWLAATSPTRQGVLIFGGTNGVLVVDGNSTITDAGTITGGTYAVQFRGGGNHRLILDSGAVLNGKVSGGGNATLELAAGNGTITGLGANIVGFGQVTIDKGGAWTVKGDSSIAAGSTVTTAGSLVESGTTTLAGHVRTVGDRLPAGQPHRDNGERLGVGGPAPPARSRSAGRATLPRA